MVEDTSKTPEGDISDSASGERKVPVPEEPENAAKQEIGGRRGPDPTRYGDWEKAGRCIDF